ncbi:copper resistance CopC family protein [Micromonospora costi]|uniref:Copper resistance protein CopC n=1 Tax=Micromonospora costi TaxID=1530042 RepID=A0A3A9ZUS7_9ACTN|nr:copper resistance protein CopC [Micromonospora costi]RKN52035.1 copper resistance protein CopC [Micromonospora costi]
MRRLPPILGRAFSGLLALVLASAVAVLAAPPPAAAHGTLAMATPADGATVNEPLAAVRLYFTEKVASNAYFTITAPGGGRVDNGWSHGEPVPLEKPVREYFLVDGTFQPRDYTTGFPAVVTLAHLPAAGRYSVSYLSVASDGDLVRGAVTFRYSGPVTAAPQGWRPPANQPDPALLAATDQHGGGSGTPPATPATATAAPAPAASATAADGGGDLGWPVWTGAAAAVAAALAGVVAWRRRPTRSARAARGSGRIRPASRRTGGAARPGRPKEVARRATTGRTATAAGSGGKRRPAAVPAARTGGVAVTARAAAVTGSPVREDTATPASSVATAVGAPGAVVADAPAIPGPEGPPVTGGPRLSNTRVGLVVGGLVVALLAGFGLGRLGAGGESAAGRTPTAPAGGAPAAGQAVSAGDGHQHAPGTGPHTHPGDAGAPPASGTVVSAGGYTLQPLERSQPAGASVDYRFRIVGPDRQAATRFAVVHDKPLHLIVVGRDLAGYQHLHPTMAPDGTWSVPLRLARAGGYRVYADFSVTGAAGTPLPLVLGVDHLVPGAHTPAPLPPPQPQATAGPFTVSMEGTPTVGVTTPMVFRVSGGGGPGPAALERYLGAYGHLVVVREGDLGYVHVHPEPELVDGAVTFWLTAPSPGRYRAFFDFQVGGTVRTAEYTITVT